MSVLRGVKNFRFSRLLFTNDDGSPKVFYSDVRSEDLEEIVNLGGGIVSEEKTDGTLNLCDDKDMQLIRDEGYIPISFIRQCVLKVTYLDPEAYRRKMAGVFPSVKLPVNEDADDFFDNSAITPAYHVSKGRTKYTDDEDMRMLMFLNQSNHHRKIRGKAIWKQMERQQLTCHTSESMRTRFLKTVLPRLHLYDIPADLREKLTGNYQPMQEVDDNSTDGVRKKRRRVSEATEGSANVLEPRDGETKVSTTSQTTPRNNTRIEVLAYSPARIRNNYSDKRKTVKVTGNPSLLESTTRVETYHTIGTDSKGSLSGKKDERAFVECKELSGIGTTGKGSGNCVENRSEKSSPSDLIRSQPSCSYYSTRSSCRNESPSSSSYYSIFSPKTLKKFVMKDKKRDVSHKEDLSCQTLCPESDTGSEIQENEVELLTDANNLNNESHGFSIRGEVGDCNNGGEDGVESDSEVDGSQSVLGGCALGDSTVFFQPICNGGKSESLSPVIQHQGNEEEIVPDSDEAQQSSPNASTVISSVETEAMITVLTSSPFRRKKYIETRPSTSKAVYDLSGSEEEDEECVDKEVTRKRVQAVMSRYKVGVADAIDVMMKNQDTLWKII